ncbi:hypothetical protein [Kitasatospora sp. GP82]|uniref:hypothetical protein n=1 Tax=Kitasatospora sp. GP82 TaxID=3035089 RepID=UPI0024772B7D|nr:hypothetical protein [Kitasatospora sp. GP82]MDH6125931.1 hypothetical protein [Kitasatospora sp. GP82]
MTERYGGMEFGLPHLARAFHRYWREEEGSDVDVLMAYTVDMPAYKVEAALIDALRLADSDVPTWAIEALWSLGTEQLHVLRDEGREGRDWLRLVIRLYREHLLAEAPPGSLTSAPPNAYVHLTGAVLDEILLVSNGMLNGSLSPQRRYVPGVVPALEQVAAYACPDLAFRFLLRALTAFGPGISQGQYERYVALGEKFEYGEFLVQGYEHLVD